MSQFNRYLLTIEVRSRGGSGPIVLLEQAWCPNEEHLAVELDPSRRGPTFQRAMDRINRALEQGSEFVEEDLATQSDPRP